MNIQTVLSEYYRWVKDCREGRIGYPSQTTFDRLRGGSVASAMISDDEAALVSAAIAVLSRRHPRYHAILESHYLQGQSVSKIAWLRKESRDSVTKSLCRAESTVEGYMLGALSPAAD